jgi:phage head maturation protease
MAIYKFITDSETKDFNDTERSFVAWASKASIDRQDEEIDPSGWLLKNYRNNPVVPLFHDYMRFPIAKSLWEKVSPKDNPVGLLFKPQFAETDIGQEAYYLYKEGFMSAFSVGFDPLEWIDGDGRSYTKDVDGEFGIWQKDYIKQKKKKPRCRYIKQELLEISGVLVPAHPEALIEARGIVKTKELSEYLDMLITKEQLSEQESENSVSISHFQEIIKRIEALEKDKPQYTGYFEQEDDDIEIETPGEVEVDLDGDLDIDLEFIEVGDINIRWTLESH